ncbi:acyl carrier protein [Gammaproteobacteria bacterium]|jgi:acyl carrier protein|nr:acyl carrier protein [Gammaproteobacteria bacterium]
MDLKKILIETFSNSSIPENIDDLKMGDLEEWDSLGNFNLILAIEQKVGIQFDFDQLENLNSISEIQKALDNDLSNK